MSAARLLVAMSGLIVWSSGLVALYAGMSLGCEAGLHRQGFAGTNVLTAILVAVLLLHVGALGALQWYGVSRWRRARSSGGSGDFIAALTCLVTATALAGMVVVGAPVLMIPPCV